MQEQVYLNRWSQLPKLWSTSSCQKKKKRKKRKENQPVTNLKLHLNPYNYIVNQKRRLCTYCFKNDKKETNTLVIVIHVIFRFVLKRTGLSYTMPSESLLENVFNYKFI